MNSLINEVLKLRPILRAHSLEKTYNKAYVLSLLFVWIWYENLAI
jgi:hypothetical protein